MAMIPDYYVDGLLSVGTHNGVHRLIFYKLSGADSPKAEPCVEVDIPANVMRSVIETMMAMSKTAPAVKAPSGGTTQR
jgi:hypothetical protein